MPTLSIVTPLYNSSKYVENLIHIFSAQTSMDFEVILIDDCSKDDTFEKMQKALAEVPFQYNLKRNLVNIGPGMSRNAALEYVGGEYVFFLDADDDLDAGTVSILAAAVEKEKYDAILFDYFIGGNGLKVKRDTVVGCKAGNISVEDALLHSTGATWCKVYRTEILRSNAVMFPDLRVKEDFAFNKVALSYCDNILYIKEHLYEYFVNPTSVMNTTQILSDVNTKEAFGFVDKNIHKRYAKMVPLLEIRDYLLGYTQRAIRNGESTGNVVAFIKKYEADRPEWYENAKICGFDKITRVMLCLIKHRRIMLLRCFVYAKDLIKKLIIRR